MSRAAGCGAWSGNAEGSRWVLHGKSAPVDMECQMIVLSPPFPQDINGDGTVNVLDLIDLLLLFGAACP